jgi:acetoin utilization deacetylase AcuC-like enzyme
MMHTAIMYSPVYLEHDTGPDHPETPTRLKAIMEELNKSGLLKTKKCAIVTPKPATMKDLELVHDSDYIELVNKTCKSGGGLLDLGDTVVSTKSCKAAVLAVGAVIDAVNMVATDKAQNAFALVRPPGHHAGPYYALGFCLFNNVAVAAAHILCRLDYKRVLILDIDAHHGNGTQEIFYDTDKVLYISLHQDPRGFPGTGFADEIGEDQGIGYNVNIPFPFRVDDEIYQEAFNQIAVPIIQQYKPQFILVSAGFDGHYTDPVAQLALSMQSYSKVFSKILNLTSQLCEGKVVVTLEGGYSLSFLGKMVTSTIANMAGVAYPTRDKGPVADLKTRKKTEQVINNVKRIQAPFWRL